LNVNDTPDNVFSVDLEDWCQGLEIDIQHWSDFAPRLQAELDPLLALLEKSFTRATFFVLGYQAERTPGIIRDIDKRGHEICSHGYSHRFVYQQSPGEFRQDIQRSKQITEALAGHAVEGYRAPFFSITKESLWAHDVLFEEGFRYDSSVFPVNNYRYGIPGANRYPDWLSTQAGHKIFEVPLSTCRVGFGKTTAGWNIPMRWGGYFRLYPYSMTRTLIHKIHKEGARLIFYVHPWKYDVNHPRIKMPRRFAQFTHYHNLESMLGKSERLLDDFRFGAIENVYSTSYRQNRK